MTVDLPECLKKPRKRQDEQRAMTQAEWEDTEQYKALAANYVPLLVTGKLDAVADKLHKILEEAENGSDERPVKVILFSNFKDTFKRLEETLKQHDLSYEYAPSCTHVMAAVCRLHTHRV